MPKNIKNQEEVMKRIIIPILTLGLVISNIDAMAPRFRNYISAAAEAAQMAASDIKVLMGAQKNQLLRKYPKGSWEYAANNVAIRQSKEYLPLAMRSLYSNLQNAAKVAGRKIALPS